MLFEEKFQYELDYGVLMSLAREWLAAGLINEDEYGKIEVLYAQKYQPIFRQESRQK
jgi:hypothetical protein